MPTESIIQEDMNVPQIEEYVFFYNTVKMLNEESLLIYNKIFDLLRKIEPLKDNNYRELWLVAGRGTKEEYIKLLDEDDKVNFSDRFLLDYPKENYWFKLSMIEDDKYQLLRLNELFIEIFNDGKKDNCFGYDLSELLYWVYESVEQRISEIENGTYNKIISDNLPYDLRYGTISRKEYWKQAKEDKEAELRGLTQNEIDEFISLALQDEQNGIPKDRIKYMTFNKYFEYASCAFKAVNFNTKGLSLSKQFFAYGEDFGSCVLENLDYDSMKDFNDYYHDRLGAMGGHPWGIRRGNSRTRLMLYPKLDSEGYYFIYFGNPFWNIYETVKIYIALKKTDCPFIIYNPKEIIDYLQENDLIGIVPNNQICCYCQSYFSNQEVNDFRHFDEDKYPQMKELIDWQDLDIIRLKGG